MKPQFSDVHAHLNFSDYDADREETIRRALDDGVWMINIGVEKKESQFAVELAEKYSEGLPAQSGDYFF